MIEEVSTKFPSENGGMLDVHNIDERNFRINYLFNMTTKILIVALSSVVVV